MGKKRRCLSPKLSLFVFLRNILLALIIQGQKFLVDFDGFDGYLAVIHQWILHPRKQDDHWTEAWLLEQVEKQFGLEAVQSFSGTGRCE